MIINQAYGGGGVKLTLTVSVTTGSAVTATDGSKIVTGTSEAGTCVLKLPEAGTWNISATLNGETTNTATVTVSDDFAVTLTYFSATITVTVASGASVTCTNGSTTYTATSDGTAVFTVKETGTWTVTATLNSQTTSGTVDVVSGTTSYALSLYFISSTLNDNEWSTISSVSDAGTGANYWAVGDRKAVALSGTVGALTLSGTYYAFIIGFNHNSSYEGTGKIHFQLAKTALSAGTDVCFTDSYYNSTNGGFRMNASNTNAGGWSSSNMRTALMGTSLTSYSGTFIGVLPAALRAVLKAVTKYTDNTGGGGGSVSSYVTSTTDYLFLLSEYEVFGTIANGNTYESSKQAQYSYYSAGNSKIKYQHSSTSAAALWWLRSPRASASGGFVCVSAGGTVYYSDANYSRGVAPGFCV